MLEEMLQTDNKKREKRLKEENEESLALLVNENKEKEEMMRRKDEETIHQLRVQSEESLARLLSKNEAEMTTLVLSRQSGGENTNVVIKRKAVDKTQPSAPECPVCALQYPTRILGLSIFCCRCALMRWCLQQESSNAAMGITSARLASESNVQPNILLLI